MDVINLLDEFLGEELAWGGVSMDGVFALLAVLFDFLLLFGFFLAGPLSFSTLIFF